jgi:hypothetical protein
LNPALEFRATIPNARHSNPQTTPLKCALVVGVCAAAVLNVQIKSKERVMPGSLILYFIALAGEDKSLVGTKLGELLKDVGIEVERNFTTSEMKI